METLIGAKSRFGMMITLLKMTNFPHSLMIISRRNIVMKNTDAKYTVTLTEIEIGMLVEATNIMHIRYKRPGVTEAAQKGAQAYADLCSKLYYCMIEQQEN